MINDFEKGTRRKKKRQQKVTEMKSIVILVKVDEIQNILESAVDTT